MAESISEGTLKQWSKRKSNLFGNFNKTVGIDAESS